jgi:hypothetical protein
MLESDYEVTKINTFFASVEEETEEELIDLFRLLLTDTENLIEVDTSRVGLPIEIDDDLFTEEVIHSISFGILWEQKSRDKSPQIVAPFGFYTIDEILERQELLQKPKLESFFWYVTEYEATWLEQKVNLEQIQRYCNLSKPKLKALQAAISFGILLESSDLEKISLPKYFQDEILEM